MTTHTFMAAPSNASDESFRVWASGISAAIEAVGFVKIPYAGAVDWSTVAAPTVAHTYPAREVFRFDDALQASAPLFFAMEYGCGSSTNGPGLRISVGKGVDGAGVLTGVLLGQVMSGMATGAASSASNANPQAHRVASCPSKACLVIAMSTTAPVFASATMILERSRDNTGAPTGDGLLLTTMQGTSAGAASALSNPFYAVAYASGQHSLGAVPVVLPYRVAGNVLGAAGSLSAGVIAPVLPWVAFAPGIAPWQPLAALTYAPGDAVAESEITVRVLGADRRYRVIGVDAGHNGWGSAPRPYEAPGYITSPITSLRQAGLMILWED